MKAAISVPDATLERAEQKAHDLGWTRSEFYSTAAERFIDQIEREDLAVDSDAAVDNVLLPKETAGLPADSVVNVTAIVTLDKADCRQVAGTVPAHLMSTVDEGLRSVMGL
ncbi:MAG: mRNA interferase MazF [Actinomycetota bacterium]|nr:mRNA interferase MazF [Actinomycetota bacterium]